MSSDNKKLSPAELLAELAAQRLEKGVASVVKPAPPRTEYRSNDDGNPRQEEARGASNGTPTADDPKDSSREGHAAPDRNDYQNTGRGAVRKKSAPSLDLLEGHEHLSELFDRVNDLLGDIDGDDSGPFRPRVPKHWRTPDSPTKTSNVSS